MRRAAPILIIVLGLLALVLSFVAVPLPSMGTTEGRTLETKLGLDLQGGLRIEYQVLPAEGKVPSPADLAVMRQIVLNRIDKSGVWAARIYGSGGTTGAAAAPPTRSCRSRISTRSSASRSPAPWTR